MTLALHAIVEAGAAWLPLDTGYPDDRLKMMLEDARPSLLITTDDQLPRFADVPDLTAFAITPAYTAGQCAAETFTTAPHGLYHLYLWLHPADQKG